MLLISFYSQKTKEWSEVKISFTDWSSHIYLPSIGWEWDRADAFPYLGQVPLPRWAQEFHNHCNMAGRASKSPVGGVTLKLFQAGSSFVLGKDTIVLGSPHLSACISILSCSSEHLPS